MGSAGSEDAVCSAEYGLHLFRLGLEVAVRALDNANRVDPHVALAEGARSDHGVEEGSGQCRNSDSGFVLLESLPAGHEVVACSPGVRESDILDVVGGLCLPEPDNGVAFGTDVDEACWEVPFLLVGLAAFGVFVAVSQPLSYDLEVCWAACRGKHGNADVYVGPGG